jgi:pimeloyl-ACP methyl ester carboxylesterase
MDKIYFISGLGADERVFEWLTLQKRYACAYIQWLEPYKRETLLHYAERLKEQIHENEAFVLIGVSFGGVVAIELAKKLKPEKVIIISSIPKASFMPLYLRLIGKSGIHQLLPAFLLKNVNFLTYYFFGVQGTKEKTLLKTIIQETNAKFLKWAISRILYWQSEITMDKLIHIHGTADKILPLPHSINVIPVEGGGHFMIVTHAAEIDQILHNLLQPDDV